jgi:hypothetical protein
MSWVESVFVRTASTPYVPARSLLWSLFQLDDGRLRLRWSDRYEKWCLERRVACGIEYLTSLPQWVTRKDGVLVENDTWIRARDGTVLIGFYDPLPRLDHWLIRDLQRYNIRRLGGAQAVELMMLRQEEHRRASLDRDLSRDVTAAAGEFYEHEQWRQGEKAAVPARYEEIRP